MAYTFANLKTDIRGYTEVDDTVLTDAICSTITKNAENRIYREERRSDSSELLAYVRVIPPAV